MISNIHTYSTQVMFSHHFKNFMCACEKVVFDSRQWTQKMSAKYEYRRHGRNLWGALNTFFMIIKHSLDERLVKKGSILNI